MRTRNHPNSTKRGSTHTFIFTHAPIVNGTIKIGISMDATHVSPNDYRFVDWVMNVKPDSRPNIEAVFCGHTHPSKAVWDEIHKVLSGTPDDRNIDFDGIYPVNTYYYSWDLLCLQTQKSTG